MEEERDILVFTERLKDSFGKIPKEGKELIRIVRLRRMAKKLGMEKVILKKGQMSLFLVNNPDSPYYQSEAFGKLLGFIQKHPRECNLREQNGKIYSGGVSGLSAALSDGKGSPESLPEETAGAAWYALCKKEEYTAKIGFSPAAASPAANVTACCSAIPTSKNRSGNML